MFILIGHHIGERIRATRRLPAGNPAGTKRVEGLAAAMRKAGGVAWILAPATAMRMSGHAWHSASVMRGQSGVPVIYAPAIGLPLLGSLAEPAAMLGIFWRLSRRHAIEGVVIYCFYNSFLFVGLFARWVLRLPVVLEIEEVWRPRWRDWLPRSETNPVQQALGWLCMRLLLPLACGVVIPARRFQKALGALRQPVMVIAGVLGACRRNFGLVQTERAAVLGKPNSDAGKEFGPQCPMRALFAGALETEHGIPLLMNAIRIMERRGKVTNIRVDICGKGPWQKRLDSFATECACVDVRSHGFLCEEEYAGLLRDADVCLALQDPQGRHADLKTPSKAWEFMSLGKATVMTNVGDLATLPETTRILLEPYDAARLANVLLGFSSADVARLGYAAGVYAKEQWDLTLAGRQLLALFPRGGSSARKKTPGWHMTGA